MIKDEATLKQRMVLTNMYLVLGWDIKGIRDMSRIQARWAFNQAKREFEKRSSDLSYAAKRFDKKYQDFSTRFFEE